MANDQVKVGSPPTVLDPLSVAVGQSSSAEKGGVALGPGSTASGGWAVGPGVQAGPGEVKVDDPTGVWTACFVKLQTLISMGIPQNVAAVAVFHEEYVDQLRKGGYLDLNNHTSDMQKEPSSPTEVPSNLQFLKSLVLSKLETPTPLITLQSKIYGDVKRPEEFSVAVQELIEEKKVFLSPDGKLNKA